MYKRQGNTKRVPAEKYIEFIKLCINNYECKFFLATGKKLEAQEILKKILNSNFKNYCKALDDLTISETLPIIKNCNLAVCNDTSFSHLSAALEIETIVLMTDSPLLYGSYSPKMHPIIPDGESSVSHDTLGKDKINPDKIFKLGLKALRSKKTKKNLHYLSLPKEDNSNVIDFLQHLRVKDEREKN